MIFIFIGGASGSGKTNLSKCLLTKLQQAEISAQKLNMDDYFFERPEGEDPEEYRIKTNFDTPDMLHLDLLKKHLIELDKGNRIIKPIFAFHSNRREGVEEIHPSEVVVVEGIFGEYFYKKFMPSEMVSITVNVASDEYLDIVDRRIQRDVKERQRNLADIVKQERRFVGPGFLKYTASSVQGTDVYVHNKRKTQDVEHQLILDTAADEIMLVLHQKRSEFADGIGGIKAKPLPPNVQNMLAKSHLAAGILPNPRRFEGYFNGVFGDYKEENFVREFAEEDTAVRAATKEKRPSLKRGSSKDLLFQPNNEDKLEIPDDFEEYAPTVPDFEPSI